MGETKEMVVGVELGGRRKQIWGCLVQRHAIDLPLESGPLMLLSLPPPLSPLPIHNAHSTPWFATSLARYCHHYASNDLAFETNDSTLPYLLSACRLDTKVSSRSLDLVHHRYFLVDFAVCRSHHFCIGSTQLHYPGWRTQTQSQTSIHTSSHQSPTLCFASTLRLMLVRITLVYFIHVNIYQSLSSARLRCLNLWYLRR